MDTPVVRITRIESFDALQALEPAWWDLCGRAAEPEIVTTPTWLLAWWRAFGDDARVMSSLAFHEGDRLVGLAPMLERVIKHRGVLPLRRVELLATGEDEAEEICSDYVGVLAERGYERSIARALAEALTAEAGGWDELHFAQMSGESSVLREIENRLAETGVLVHEKQFGVCPYICLPKTWDDYVKSLDSKSRYLVSRALRELDKWAGKDGWKLRRVTKPEELADGREVLHRLHETRWKAEGHDGVFVRDRFRSFHDEVMPKLLARGELDLIWLEVKGQPVAVLYNVLYGKKVYVYQSGRTEEVPKNLRIGIAMNCVAVQDYIKKGFVEYDFLNGLSQYKRQMCAGRVRPLVTLHAASPTPRGKALAIAREATEFAAERARAIRDEWRRRRGEPPVTSREASDGEG